MMAEKTSMELHPPVSSQNRQYANQYINNAFFADICQHHFIRSGGFYTCQKCGLCSEDPVIALDQKHNINCYFNENQEQTHEYSKYNGSLINKKDQIKTRFSRRLYLQNNAIFWDNTIWRHGRWWVLRNYPMTRQQYKEVIFEARKNDSTVKNTVIHSMMLLYHKKVASMQELLKFAEENDLFVKQRYIIKEMLRFGYAVPKYSLNERIMKEVEKACMEFKLNMCKEHKIKVLKCANLILRFSQTRSRRVASRYAIYLVFKPTGMTQNKLRLNSRCLSSIRKNIALKQKLMEVLK